MQADQQQPVWPNQDYMSTAIDHSAATLYPLFTPSLAVDVMIMAAWFAALVLIITSLLRKVKPGMNVRSKRSR
jgi:hypothetical protein